MNTCVGSDGWEKVLSWCPPDLEEMAATSGAMFRRRGFSSAGDLLRVILGYVSLREHSLRMACDWAKEHGIADISAPALLLKLRQCRLWLARLVSRMTLGWRDPSLASFLGRVRIVDATHICRKGAKGVEQRVHVRLNLPNLVFDHVAVTTQRVGETLLNFPFQEGEIVLADGGYPHREGLWHVLRCGAHFLVRISLGNVPLRGKGAEPLDALGLLRSLKPGEAGDWEVVLPADAKKQVPAMQARLIAIPKGAREAAESRRRLVQRSRAKHHTPDPVALEAAGYVLLLTSLDRTHTAEELLALYRVRWQVEMLFKRLKSLLNLGDQPFRDPEAAQAFLYAKLLLALLARRAQDEEPVFSPLGHCLPCPSDIRVEGPPKGGSGGGVRHHRALPTGRAGKGNGAASAAVH